MGTKKTLSTELSEVILDHFTDYVVGAGYVKYRAIEAGMKAFMALPVNAQNALMDENLPQEEVRAIVEQSLLDDATVRLLSGLTLQERQSAIQLAKKAARKSSGKKSTR